MMTRKIWLLWTLLSWPCYLMAQQDWHEQPISFSFVNLPVEQAVRRLENGFGLRFSYDPEHLEGLSITAQSRARPLPKALEQLLKGSGLTYELTTIAVVIKPLPQAAYELTGRVSDAQTKESLPGAVVQLAGEQRYHLTNNDGFFTIKGLTADSLRLRVRYLGYPDLELSIARGQARSLVELALSGEPWMLPTAKVQPTDDEVIDIEPWQAGTVVIHPARLANIPSLGEHDIIRSAQNVAFGAANETSAGLNIRGGTSEQNLVMFDDFIIYHQDHFFGVFSAFNPEVVKSVRIYKSGFGAEYGGRISGVVDIRGKDGNREKISGTLGGNMLSTSAVLEVPVGQRFSLLIGGRRAYTDLLQTPTYRNLFDRISGEEQSFVQINNSVRSLNAASTPEFYFYDYNLKASLYPTERDVVSLAYYRGQDFLDASSNPSDSARFVVLPSLDTTVVPVRYRFEDRTDWGNEAFSFKWARQWKNLVYSKFTLGQSNFQSRYSLEQSAELSVGNAIVPLDYPNIAEDNRVKDLSATGECSFVVGRHTKLYAGGQFTDLRISYRNTYQQDNQDFIIHNISQQGQTMTFFSKLETWPSQRLSVIGGLRASYFSGTQQWYFAPRFSAALQLNADSSLIFKAAIGRYFQFVNRAIFPDAYGLNRDFWALSDINDVPVMRSDHFTLGLNYQKKHFTIDAEAYYKPIHGLIEYQVRFDQNLFNLESYQNFFAKGIGQSFGVELLGKYQKGIYTTWLGYAFSRILYQFDQLNQGNYFPANHDRPHQLNLLQQLQWKRWEFSANLILASGTPYSIPYWTYDIQLLNGETLTLFDVGSKNGQRLPTYHRLDVAATYHFTMGKINGKTGISLFNVYNRQNIRTRIFQELPSSQADNIWRVNEIKLLGFIPNIFLYLKF